MRIFTSLLAMAALSVAAPVAAAKDPLKVQTAQAFKGVQDVVIGSFTVGFLMEKTDTARAGGGLLGGRGGGGRSTARQFLGGVTPAELQAITDAAYEDFKAQVAARGLSVSAGADLLSSPAYAKVKPVAAPYEAAVAFGSDAKAKATYFAPTELRQLVLYPGDVMAGGLGAIGMNMAAGQAQMGATNYAKSAGKSVVNILYLIDFADAEKYGGWFRSSSAVKVKAGLAVAPGSSRLTLFSPGGKVGSIALNDPVAIGGDFAEVSDTTSGSAKAAEAVGNVIGFLGGVGTSKSRRYTFAAQPALYSAAAVEAAKQTNTRLVERLVALR